MEIATHNNSKKGSARGGDGVGAAAIGVDGIRGIGGGAAASDDIGGGDGGAAASDFVDCIGAIDGGDAASRVGDAASRGAGGIRRADRILGLGLDRVIDCGLHLLLAFVFFVFLTGPALR